MRHTDREAGHRAFSLTYKRKGIFALENPPYAMDNRKGAHVMPNIAMTKFAEFCVGNANKRARIIAKRTAAQQQHNARRERGEPTGGGDYYAGLRKVFREKHWETNDIHQLDEAVFDIDLSKRGNSKRLQTYQDLKRKYVDKWQDENATSYFKVAHADVSFGALNVTVNPEVGMRAREVERAFKLWFGVDDLQELNILDVCYYLLWEAAGYASWPRPWTPGIWDVRRSKLYEAVSPRTGMEEWVRQCADEFVAQMP